MTNRHKVFISFHSKDNWYKDQLVKYNAISNMFDDYSVGPGDISDELSDEQIRKKIRDDFIRDATVLILLCGNETKNRKFIDWELHAAMFDTEKNPKMGIVVINLPTINQYCRAITEEEKELISPNSQWETIEKRTEYENCYPYMPSRLIENFCKGAPISVVNWDRICMHPNILKDMIDIAFKRRKEAKYDISTPLRRRNS